MDVRFADPWILLLLLAVPALALFVLRFRVDGRSIAVGTVSPARLARRTWRVRLEPALAWLRLVAVALLIVALARPQRGEAVAESEGEGIDIVLAFDISSSMTNPFARGQTRLEAAESVLRQFVEARQNDRVGLVVFRGNSLNLSPLTSDYTAVADAVDYAGGLRLEDGTAIGTAIAESVNLLRQSQSASRIVILLTDGENNSPTIEPLAAARIAERLGIRVYTVGVVSRVPGRSSSTVNVDEAALREIANVTGATYNRAEDPAALQAIYDEIDRLEKSRFDAVETTRYAEVAPYLLAAAGLALAFEVLLRATAFRRAA
jgi:Ca-activated chloride channel family protein